MNQKDREQMTNFKTKVDDLAKKQQSLNKKVDRILIVLQYYYDIIRVSLYGYSSFSFHPRRAWPCRTYSGMFTRSVVARVAMWHARRHSYVACCGTRFHQGNCHNAVATLGRKHVASRCYINATALFWGSSSEETALLRVRELFVIEAAFSIVSP